MNDEPETVRGFPANLFDIVGQCRHCGREILNVQLAVWRIRPDGTREPEHTFCTLLRKWIAAK